MFRYIRNFLSDVKIIQLVLLIEQIDVNISIVTGLILSFSLDKSYESFNRNGRI